MPTTAYRTFLVKYVAMKVLQLSLRLQYFQAEDFDGVELLKNSPVVCLIAEVLSDRITCTLILGT